MNVCVLETERRDRHTWNGIGQAGLWKLKAMVLACYHAHTPTGGGGWGSICMHASRYVAKKEDKFIWINPYLMQFKHGTLGFEHMKLPDGVRSLVYLRESLHLSL